jgi:hypothetical protein
MAHTADAVRAPAAVSSAISAESARAPSEIDPESDFFHQGHKALAARVTVREPPAASSKRTRMHVRFEPLAFQIFRIRATNADDMAAHLPQADGVKWKVHDRFYNGGKASSTGTGHGAEQV